MTDAGRPPLSALRRRLDDLTLPAGCEQARWVLAHPVGPWLDGGWRDGQDVAVRAVYVLPAGTYLGLRSFRDELDAFGAGQAWTLDLVAFEVEKAARLILKGHRPTLRWLVKRQPMITSAEAEPLREIAACRLSALGRLSEEAEPPPGPHSLYDALDELVRRLRLGAAPG